MRRLVLVAAFAAFALPARAAGPDFDATIGRAPGAAAAARLQAARADAALARVGTPAHFDERYGVPSFVWGTRGPSAAPRAAFRPAPGFAARDFLARLAPYYGLDAADVQGATLRSVHDTGRGGIIACFIQSVDGIEVFRDELKILMDRDLSLLAASGYIPGRSLLGRAASPAFSISDVEAVKRALDDFGGAPTDRAAILGLGSAEGGYARFDVAAAARHLPSGMIPGPARAKKVLFHLPDALEPAWYVELMSADAATSYVFSATDGRLLFRHDQTASDVFNYRVWADGTEHLPQDGPQGNVPTPHPTGNPDLYAPGSIAPSLISWQNGPISTNDPWLAPAATTSSGNNVDAYADLAAPDGFSAGDLRATTTSANTFDRVYNPALAPNSSAAQEMAAITQLFFDNNLFHDWYYDVGFNEISGNAQASNYGRGGIGGDALHAEAQDYGGLNNANMSTPSDGASPRMQMYVWGSSKLTISAPGGIAGDYQTGNAAFGSIGFSLTGDIALINDGTGTTSDACEASAGVAGKIALIDRGTCTFVIKVKNAQNAGAIGAIIVDNVAAPNPPGMSGTDATITIPVLSVTSAVGGSIKTALGGGVVTVTMVRVNNDGTIDNQVVAHEWGHYISNRLIGNANGLSTNMSGGLGEGWADFHAMLMTVKPEDALVPANANFNGVYGMAGYALAQQVPTNNYYYGIRRCPYSTDMTKNALTFQHIQAGVPLPVGPPTSFGADGANNAEVHATGEVWCNMLWECYAALLRDTGRLTFAQARDRMRGYLVAAYKMTPNAPTLLEARDALLAAALAGDPADFQLFWTAFAKRGAGVGAVAPDRFSATNVPVTESYAVGGDLALISATLTDDLHSCDTDGYVDRGERGQLIVTVKNVGATSLSATTVSLSSSNPNVTFPSGNSRPVAATAPFGSAVAAVPVEIANVAGVQTIDLTILYADPGMLSGSHSATFYDYGNADEAPASSDLFEAHTNPWTMLGSPAGYEWKKVVRGALDRRMLGTEAGGIEDQSLTSPPLNVAGTGTFSFSFNHLYSFEKDATNNYDGGVLELSNNGGASWSDIGASATPGYGGTLYAASGNPLGGRSAFVGNSPSYPALNAVTVNLGTTYQGQTVRIRFRLGADAGTGGPGWEIANVNFTNITNQPFFDMAGETFPCVPLTVEPPLPHELSFALASANPGPSPRLRFALPAAARVDLAIYDLAGRRMATLASGEYPAGIHLASWDGTRLAREGVYFALLRVDAREFRRTVVLLH